MVLGAAALPLPLPPAEPEPPTILANLPLMCIDDSVSPPTAALTPRRPAIEVTFLSATSASPIVLVTASREKRCPCFCALPGFMPNCCGSPDPRCALWVTVMSVPTP